MPRSSDAKRTQALRLRHCSRVCRSAYRSLQRTSRTVPERVWVLLLGSEVCRLSAECLDREGVLDPRALALCANLSALSALACERTPGGAPSASACYRCAQSCLASLFASTEDESLAGSDGTAFRVA